MEVIRARVIVETKREITATAEREMLSESAWLYEQSAGKCDMVKKRVY